MIATLSVTVPTAWWVNALLVVAFTITGIATDVGVVALEWRSLGDVVAVDLVVFVVLVVAVGGLGRLRTWISFIADLAGFWPVRVHPLAGTSYRDGVTDTLQQYLDGMGERHRIVLVGHSQGSVICAWFVRQLKLRPLAHEIPVHLVTCGSPLRSLYARLFPSDFSELFFDDVATTSRSWDNFWRTTDPIAGLVRPLLSEKVRLSTRTSEAEHQVVDHWLSDPASFGRRRYGHGDYWVSAEQQATVKERLDTSTKGDMGIAGGPM